MRAHLRLAEPAARSHVPVGVAFAALAALLALAAAQPVVVRTRAREVRKDAEVYTVFDTSGSMAAATSPTAPTRFDRAKQIALRLRDRFPEVPFGVASFAELALPHLFPSPNEQVFAATLRDAVRIGEPPSPNITLRTVRATDLSALAGLGSGNGFFSRDATHRVIVVFSDDESNRFYMNAVSAAFRHPPAVVPIYVHVWNPADKVYIGKRPDPNYAPDLGSGQFVAELASATGGRVYEEQQFAGLVDAVRSAIGSGSMTKVGSANARAPLAVWLLLAAFVPLGFLLRRRNL